MMQSSEALQPLSQERIIEALAQLESEPAQSKAIAKSLGVGEIMLYRWRTAWEKGEPLNEPVAMEPEPTVSQEKKRRASPLDATREKAVAAWAAGEGTLVALGARFGCSSKTVQKWVADARKAGAVDLPVRPNPVPQAKPPEVRAAAVAAYLAKEGSLLQVARRFGVSQSGLSEWVTKAREKEVTKPMPNTPQQTKTRAHYAPAVQYQAARDYLDGLKTMTQLCAEIGCHSGSVYSWVQKVKNKELKAPRGKSGPKPKTSNGAAAAPTTEVVELHQHSRQTSLALPSHAGQSMPMIGRVVTQQDELLRLQAEVDYWKAEAERWKKKAGSAFKMVMEDE